MIARSRERDFQAKEEGESNEVRFSKPPSSSSRQWSAFRNPRIVRVSRSFGGKDRHSKVCTIRGLRDRRIRLSVPTAIQLYDLQDRLGLGQPSKVVDWLLDNTKDDIDKLPPLPIPQGFGQFHHQPMLFSHDHSSSATPQPSLPTFFDANSTFMRDSRLFHSLGININRGLDGEDQIAAPVKLSSKDNLDLEASLKLKSKEIENSGNDREKGKWISKVNEGDQNQGGVGNYISSGHGQVLSAQNLFPSSSNSSLPGNLLNNSMSAFNPYYHWDASNLSLSQYGNHGFLPQTDTSLINSNTTSTVPLPSSLTLPSGSQLFFCPPATLPSLFPSYPPYITTPMENESREINHFALLGSNSQNLLTNSRTMKPFSLNVNPGLFHSHSTNESHPDKQNNS